MDITKGSHITARHIKSGDLKHYRVVVERGTRRKRGTRGKIVTRDVFRLLNLNSYYVMCGFKTEKPNEVIDYIEKNLKCEIIKISM